MVLTSGVLRGVRTALLVVASALVMVLAGCGQKGDTGSGTPPADATTVGGPVTILVAAAPGGAEDLMNRLLAPKLSEVLGVDVAIKNAVGGGGLEAIQELQANDADGRTLLAVSPPGEYMSKLGGAELGDESYTMIGSANTDPGLIAVPKDSPFKTLADFNDFAKTHKANAGVTRLNSSTAVFALNYFKAIGAEPQLVPYTGGSELTAGLLGGQLDAAFRAGGFYDLYPSEINILAVADDKRIALLPDVPTVKEAIGVDYTFDSYRGLAVKKGTPDGITKTLADAFQKAANDPEIKSTFFDKTGFNWQFTSMADLPAIQERLNAQVGDVADQIGLHK
jgi:tripartite-type tricarboxylate transporter receptor subunit TctC